MMSKAPHLSHIGASGEANMVDVGGKAEKKRTATAGGYVRVRAQAPRRRHLKPSG